VAESIGEGLRRRGSGVRSQGGGRSRKRGRGGGVRERGGEQGSTKEEAEEKL